MRIALCCSLISVIATDVIAQSSVHSPVSASNTKVPQTLLSLVHAREVQEELGVKESNRDEFESALREIDARWWPARILAEEKQRAIISELEQKLTQLVQGVLGEQSLSRLREIEYQSQGIRVLARPEVVKLLRLDANQKQKINSLFETTDKLASGISPQKADPTKQKSLQKAKEAETKSSLELLTPQQSKALYGIFGKTFETTKLERIYPLAPELFTNKSQYGTNTVDLKELRGKVVLVHFYAFQCHNCVANFKHYKRWSEALKEKGVEVIGIQTPETPDESDPIKISNAASKEGFQFPVIMDLKRENWDAWGNTMWPTVYVIDKHGYIRFWWQGELNWDGATGDKTIETLVDRLLQEP